MYLNKPDTGPDISRLRLDTGLPSSSSDTQTPLMYMPQPQTVQATAVTPQEAHPTNRPKTAPGKIRIARTRPRVPEVPVDVQRHLVSDLSQSSSPVTVNLHMPLPPSPGGDPHTPVSTLVGAGGDGSGAYFHGAYQQGHVQPAYHQGTTSSSSSTAFSSSSSMLPSPTSTSPGTVVPVSTGAATVQMFSSAIPRSVSTSTFKEGGKYQPAVVKRTHTSPIEPTQHFQPASLSPTRKNTVNHSVPPPPAPATPGTLTVDQFETVRRHAVTQSHDPRAQLELAKRLCEAADHLSHRYTDPAHPSTRDVGQDQQQANRDSWTTQALTIARQLANKTGFADAQFFLGSVWSSGGYGVEANSVKALEYYLRAARQDHPDACYRVAVCEEFGVGTQPSLERALQFYKRAALLGNIGAMYKLGMLALSASTDADSSPRDFSGGLSWLQRAAELADARNPHALHELALLYEHAPTSCYTQGDPLPLSPSRALELYVQAAGLGYAPAQARLGRALEFGELGCEIDPTGSVEYYYAAANQGDGDAELALAGWYWTGGPSIPKSETDALQWAERAAQRGNARALYCLGYFCESGVGQPADVERAFQCYEIAAQRGHARAIERVTARRLGRK